MKFETLRAIAGHIAEADLVAASAAIDAALSVETGTSWQRELRKLQAVMVDGEPRFKVLAVDGNSKLPFVAFSSLPGVGFCPGAGSCLQFCYSFRSWRYPAAFARQAQNAVLMLVNRAAILAALDSVLPTDGSQIDLRLYVDGDFKTVDEVGFWMDALRSRPQLRAYGYSKSWQQLLDYSGEWPTNYLLNLSSGSMHGAGTEAAVRQLPIVRGRFIAVSMGRKVTAADHGNRDHQAALRAAHGSKAFTCPGKCGSCTAKGHACGSPRFRGVDVIIAVH